MEAEKRIAVLEAQLVAKDALLAEANARIAVLEEQIAALSKQVEALSEKLRQDSRNSPKPPSSDGPGSRKRRKRKKPSERDKGARKRGGQKGHEGSTRELVPAEEVDEIIEVFPEHCENCWDKLPREADSQARRHQEVEIPEIKPRVTEYRRHEVVCPRCGYKTRGTYDEQVHGGSPFGPRLMSVVALLTGVFHVSRRQAGALLADLVGLRISLGGISAIEKRVSEAVKPAVQEACLQVDKGEVKHADGTSWMKSGKSMALWTIATADATVFKIVANGSRATLESLFDDRSGILVSDRAKALGFWSIQQRQICWAHLLRRFVSFSERDGPGGELGRELLNLTGIMFEYWHDLKEGRMDRERFRRLMAPVQRHLEAQLYQGVAAEITGVSGSCADILAHREALWTFVSRSDVEPTNNHAERELRRFVLWRKRSFGTQSERGNRFAEALMTLAHTAKKQGLDLLAFLTACCRANRHGEAPPSLVAPADAGLVS